MNKSDGWWHTSEEVKVWKSDEIEREAYLKMMDDYAAEEEIKQQKREEEYNKWFGVWDQLESEKKLLEAQLKNTDKQIDKYLESDEDDLEKLCALYATSRTLEQQISIIWKTMLEEYNAWHEHKKEELAPRKKFLEEMISRYEQISDIEKVLIEEKNKLCPLLKINPITGFHHEPDQVILDNFRKIQAELWAVQKEYSQIDELIMDYRKELNGIIKYFTKTVIPY